MIFFSDVDFHFDPINIQRYLVAYRHFEANHRQISNYIACTDFVHAFNPPVEWAGQTSFLQPQLLNNQLYLVGCFPQNLGATKKKELKGGNNRIIIFSYHKDESSFEQLRDRVRNVAAFKNKEIENFSFTQENHGNSRPMNSMIFCLYVNLMLLETKYTPTLLKQHFSRTSLMIMKTAVTKALTNFINFHSEVESPPAKKKRKAKTVTIAK